MDRSTSNAPGHSTTKCLERSGKIPTNMEHEHLSQHPQAASERQQQSDLLQDQETEAL